MPLKLRRSPLYASDPILTVLTVLFGEPIIQLISYGNSDGIYRGKVVFLLGGEMYCRTAGIAKLHLETDTTAA